MKLALIGPGNGHNIEPFLMYLNKSNIEIDFFYHGIDDFSKEYIKITFIPFFSLKSFSHAIRIRKYDIVWLMGGGRLVYVLPFFFWLKKKNCTTILHIWSESLPRLAVKKSFKGQLTGLFVSRFSVINCNWYGTAEVLKEKFLNVAVNPLGLTKDYFLNAKSPDVELLKIIEIIDDSTYNFFYPKSFTYSSRHDIVIKAAALLKGEVAEHFKIYFWEGNVVQAQRKQEIEELIETLGVSDVIIILKKVKFFAFGELNLLWGKMDCGLQIAEYDQLSNTVFEPLINRKDIVISDIRPYHFIQGYFGFLLPLSKLETNDIAREMKGMILGSTRATNEELELRLQSIKKNYLFENNFKLVLDKYAKP